MGILSKKKVEEQKQVAGVGSGGEEPKNKKPRAFVRRDDKGNVAGVYLLENEVAKRNDSHLDEILARLEKAREEEEPTS